MEVGEDRRPGALVEIVDVLSHDADVAAGHGGPAGDSLVTRVGGNRAHEMDAPEVPRIAQRLVACPGMGSSELGGVEVLPETGLRIAEGRHTGFGGHPSAGEDRDAPSCSSQSNGSVEGFASSEVHGHSLSLCADRPHQLLMNPRGART